jgi:hypothetical protein
LSPKLEILVNSFESYTSSKRPFQSPAGTTIALFHGNLQDWLPGVAGSEPRLGSGFLGGQFIKGGLHQPPFSFRPVVLPLFFVVVGRYGISASRECVIEVVLLRGPCSIGALLFSRPPRLPFPPFHSTPHAHCLPYKLLSAPPQPRTPRSTTRQTLPNRSDAL